MMAKKKTKKKKEKKNLGQTNRVIVQKMNNAVAGKLKKYERLEAREFVDFTHFSSLALKHVKQACKNHYNQQIGSCDVLNSDRGLSCVKDSQIAANKVFWCDS